MRARLYDKYRQEVMPKLASEFGYKNLHQVPTLVRVVVNVGAGKSVADSKYLEIVTNSLRKITGQQPVPTTAKHSIAGFKLRQRQKIGLKVTLRGQRMYDFLDRLISVVLPRTRDFHGLSRLAFDNSGNYSIGFADQSAWPELTYEDTATLHGLEITIVTSSGDTKASSRLLELLGLPLERSTANVKS